MSSSGARALQRSPEAGDTVSSPKTNWLFLFLGIIVFTIAMMLVSFPVGLYTVFGTHLSSNYTASTPITAVTYNFVFGTVELPFESNLGGLFLFVSVIYLGFLSLAAWQGWSFISATFPPRSICWRSPEPSARRRAARC